MRKLVSISLLALWFVVTPFAVADDSTAIAQLASSFHVENRFDGAVLVAKGDEILYEAGFGEADRSWGIPNRPDTVFLVGSVSKQFTAMLILQLAAEGKLSLMDPLSKHLPDYPDNKANITIHQLLTHTSGLPHYAGFFRIAVNLNDYLRLDRTVESYVDLIGRLPLDFEPGSEHDYSSMGYIVLAYIAEQVTGKSYGQLIEERIAEPIGVSDLGFAYNDETVERLAHGYMFDLRKAEDDKLTLEYYPEPYRDQSNKYSTGGVHGSVRALFHWARAAMGDELLEPAWRDQMFTPHAENYGYGWRIDSGDTLGLAEDVEVISHGGSLSGYKASIVILDRGRYTVIALGNSSAARSSALTQSIAQMLYDVDVDAANVLGTAVAWRMVRNGPDVATDFFREQQAAGFPDYVESDYAFYIYAERFADLGYPAYGQRLAELGLEAHPDSAQIVLGLAMNQHALGDSSQARANAEKSIKLAGEQDGPDYVAEHAQELIEEIDKAMPVAVGE
ncbi:MAG: serine hydrolase [Acidobacteriota bacterium]